MAQSVAGLWYNPQDQVILVEEESKKAKESEAGEELVKENFFERSSLQIKHPISAPFIVLLKINFQSSLFRSLPERPPKQA